MTSGIKLIRIGGFEVVALLVAQAPTSHDYDHVGRVDVSYHIRIEKPRQRFAALWINSKASQVSLSNPTRVFNQ